jgi:CHAD domain-containing protein
MAPQRKEGPVLARTHVRSLLEAQCRTVREAASRVARPSAEEPADDEAIHDYRVALRRLRTLLAALAPLFEKRPLGRGREGLRRLAHTAGAVRDEEVLAETLAGFDLPDATRSRVDAWLCDRARRERRLRAAVIEELTPGPAPPGATPEGSTLAVLLSLVETLPLRRKAIGPSTRSLARDALRECGRKIVKQAARPDAESPEARHRLRIRWKRLRYTAELFSGPLANEGPSVDALAHLIKTAAHMQKRLGEVHDLDAAIACVTRARALSPGDRMVVHHRLRTARMDLSARVAKELPEALSVLPSEGGIF